MTNQSMNLGRVILGLLILTGCNTPSSGTPETAGTIQGVTQPISDDTPTHFAYLVQSTQVAVFGIDPRTNQFVGISGQEGVNSNYQLCSIKIHPLYSNLMYATQCGNQAQQNGTGGVMEFSLDSTGKITLLGTYLEGGNQVNGVSPKDLGFDASGNLYVRWLTVPVGISPNLQQNEWLEKYSVNSTTGLVSLQQTVTASQLTTANGVNTYATAHSIHLTNNQSQELDNFDYVINASGNVDLYENGNLTSYTYTGEGNYLSIAVK